MFAIYLMTRGVVDMSYLEKGKTIDYKFNIRKSFYPLVQKINEQKSEYGAINLKFFQGTLGLIFFKT